MDVMFDHSEAGTEDARLLGAVMGRRSAQYLMETRDRVTLRLGDNLSIFL